MAESVCSRGLSKSRAMMGQHHESSCGWLAQLPPHRSLWSIAQELPLRPIQFLLKTCLFREASIARYKYGATSRNI
jgi:hypothetical protein